MPSLPGVVMFFVIIGLVGLGIIFFVIGGAWILIFLGWLLRPVAWFVGAVFSRAGHRKDIAEHYAQQDKNEVHDAGRDIFGRRDDG
jgi:hypothetical protein